MKITNTLNLIRLALPAALLAVAGGAWGVESVAPPNPTSQADVKKAEAPPADPNAIVMTVNGTSIKRSEIDRVIALILAANPTEHKLSPEMKQKGEIAARQKMVEMVILYDAGSKELSPDLDKQVAARMAEKRERFPSGQAYQEVLTATGMSEKEVTEFTRKEVVISDYVQKNYINKIAVSDEAAKAFYDKNHEKFKRMEESRRVSQILIGFDTAKVTPEQKKAYRDKVDAIQARLAKGESFEELAKKESSCPSARSGGDLDYIAKGQMIPAFEKTAFALKKGEISQVVETRQGYHIIKLVEIKEAEYVPFAEAKDKIKGFIRIEEGKKNLDVYLAAEKAKATIVMIPTGKAM
jgi:peptidyl-prolyl cis-trans isomerase C